MKRHRLIAQITLGVLLGLWLGLGQVSAQELAAALSKGKDSPPQKKEASQTLQNVLEDLKSSRGIYFMYNGVDLKNKQVLSKFTATQSVETILEDLLKPIGLSFKKIGNIYVIFDENDKGETNRMLQSLEAAAAVVKISGRVVSDKGDALPGVTVVVKSTTIGTSTDSDGRFNLAVPDDLPNPILVISYIGFTSKEVPLNNQTVVNVSLEVDNKALEEVVVVGYGTSKKVNLTGSISTVDPKELTSVPMPTISQALMGRTSGVFIKNVNGQPGENKTGLNIRGFGPALIIIDGLPATDNDFNQLDPNDIENISVLKDAASAAVYGARAGNGVVLVTTRRGGVSDAKLTYSGNYALQFFAVVPNFVTSEQYARMENISRYNEGLAPIWTDDQIQKFADGSDPNQYPNTDWWNETLRTYAPQAQHNLNIQGGTEKVKYFVSGGYYSQEGLERDSETKSKRYNLRSNIDVAITKKLNLGLNLSLMNQDYIGPLNTMERTRENTGIMTRLFRSRPYFPAQYPDPTKLPTMGGGDDAPTVLTKINNVGYRDWNKLTTDAKMVFSYDLPFGLKARANFHFYRVYDQFKEKSKRTPTYTYNWGTDEYTRVRYTSDPSRLYQRTAVANNLNQQYFLTWDKTFGNHFLNALAVYEVLSDDSEWMEASRIRYDFDIDYLFAGPDLDKDNNGRASQGGRKGLVTRVNYDYQGKYLVELNSRVDASPKFPSDTRWGFFPSASVGWRISEEGFFRDNLPFINNLKLRASYGNLGFDNVGNFQYLQTFSITSQYIYDGVSNLLEKGIRADALANRTITWEKMTTTNAGLDFNLWGNKLEGSFDYFYRLRTDVLGNRIVSLPNVVGANMPHVNYAQYDNRGFEFTLNHRNTIGQVDYRIGGNISWNREKSLLIDQTEFASAEARRRGNHIGQWTDQWWGKMTAGLFQTQEEIENWADQDGRNNATILPGDVKIIDYNGDGRITAEDDVLIGRGTYPKLMFGQTLSVAWKGIEVGMLWQGAALFDINLRRSPDLTLPFYAGNTPITAMLQDSYVPVMENQWLPANTTNARWPRYRTDNYNRSHASFGFNDFWLINGNYLRLKNLEVGYTIPGQITKKWGIEKSKVFASGSNLLTFSALDFLDPEIDTSPARTMGDYYPPVGTYNLGVLIQF